MTLSQLVKRELTPSFLERLKERNPDLHGYCVEQGLKSVMTRYDRAEDKTFIVLLDIPDEIRSSKDQMRVFLKNREFIYGAVKGPM